MHVRAPPPRQRDRRSSRRSPTHPQDFSFTAGGGLSPTSFSLDDDADGTLSNTRTFTDVSAQSGYSLAETVPGGWDQSARDV